MHLITSLLLVNRIFIKEGYVSAVLAVFEKYNLSCLLSPNDSKQNGPFIYQIFKYLDYDLTIADFKQFVIELTPLLDLYRGVRPFTYAEFYIKVFFEEDSVVLTHAARNEVIVAMNHEKGAVVMETLIPTEDKIAPIKPARQKRISVEEYSLMKTGSFALI